MTTGAPHRVGAACPGVPGPPLRLYATLVLIALARGPSNDTGSVHMKMRVGVGMGPRVRVVGREGQVLDEMCSSGPGRGAPLDSLPRVDLGARDGQSVFE